MVQLVPFFSKHIYSGGMTCRKCVWIIRNSIWELISIHCDFFAAVFFTFLVQKGQSTKYWSHRWSLLKTAKHGLLPTTILQLTWTFSSHSTQLLEWRKSNVITDTYVLNFYPPKSYFRILISIKNLNLYLETQFKFYDCKSFRK